MAKREEKACTCIEVKSWILTPRRWQRYSEPSRRTYGAQTGLHMDTPTEINRYNIYIQFRLVIHLTNPSITLIVAAASLMLFVLPC